MKTILLIEDNSEMRENTIEILELANYNVISAENGQHGVEMAILHGPDLIISDVSMPKLDGFDTLRALRNQDVAKEVPFIFLTARCEKDFKQTAHELGAAVYMTKPFDGYELLKIVAEKI